MTVRGHSLTSPSFALRTLGTEGFALDIGAFLPSLNGILRERVLVELIKVDQENCWRGGVQRLLEAYLSDWPELTTREDALVELLKCRMPHAVNLRHTAQLSRA